MDIRGTIQRLINIQSPGRMLRTALLPLTLCSGLYRFGMAVRAALYARTILSTRHAPCKVIAVGNLTVGGTGKTPTVCHIARHLHRTGAAVVVATRGYRGSATDSPRIVSDGATVQCDVEAVGDEAWMMARTLPGIPVIAGRDRFAVARMAVQLFRAGVVVLDDGFQYLSLARDADVVLVNARNPFGNGFVLPRGTLREPVSALARASVIVLTKVGDVTETHPALEETIKALNPSAPVFRAVFQPLRLTEAGTGREVALGAVTGRRGAGLCSIGDPAHFFALLQELGVVLTERLAFADHHRYHERDYAWIRKRCAQAEVIITTEKDIAKIDAGMIDKEKLLVLEIGLVLDNEALFFEKLADLIAQESSRGHREVIS